MRLARSMLTGVIVGGFALGGAIAGGLAPTVPAQAELTAESTCRASGSFRTSGIVVDATATGVVTVPRRDTVSWQASVPSPPAAYSGSVWVDLPPPFGRVEIESWSGVSQSVTNAGTEEYDLPKLVPAGVEFTVSGEHVDANGTCSGSITIEIDGSPLSSPITWVGLGGAAATGIGLTMALRPLFRRAS